PAGTASRGQPDPILAPGGAHGGALMPRQLQEQPPISRVPHIDVAIIAPSNQARAIRTPGHPTDPERQLPADPAKSACAPLPQQHATPKGSAGQPRAIGTPGQAPEGGVGLVTAADELGTPLPCHTA